MSATEGGRGSGGREESSDRLTWLVFASHLNKTDWESLCFGMLVRRPSEAAGARPWLTCTAPTGAPLFSRDLFSD